MTTPTTLAPATVADPDTVAENGSHPVESWDNDDWHKARTRVELPSEHHLRAYWHAEILDEDYKNHHTKIIERREELLVRFRVELKGRLWKCIDGDFCFNLGFTPYGDGKRFNLSDLLPPGELDYKDWEGCRTDCIEKCVTVPCDTIPEEYCGTVYNIAAWFELHCCGECRDKDSTLAVSGFEKLGAYQFVR